LNGTPYGVHRIGHSYHVGFACTSSPLRHRQKRYGLQYAGFWLCYHSGVQWSKLRFVVKSLICPELRERVDFHVTGYHQRRSTKVRTGEITVDGKPVLRLSYDRFCQEGLGWFAICRTNGVGAVPSSNSGDETAWCPEQRDEIHPPQQLGDALRAYIDMPIELALKFSNPFIRSLAIIDRRVGRRTIEALDMGNDDHSLVREFYQLRIHALAIK
jgi:hypothetical protein